MPSHLVLVGGGHAHLTLLQQLKQLTTAGVRVTLVSPERGHDYSGMGPGMLGGLYTPQQLRFDLAAFVATGAGELRLGTVNAVAPEQRQLSLSDGTQLDYDLASFNCGSYVPLGKRVAENEPRVWPVKPIANLLRAKETVLTLKLERSMRLLVVGGGAAGLEVVGNLWRLLQREGIRGEVTLVGRLLPDMPPSLRERARVSLQQRGIILREEERAERLEGGVCRLTAGEELPFDVALIATGTRPLPLFRAAELTRGSDDGLAVNEFLHHPDYPEIFGGGDCIHFLPRPLDRVGVYAVRQNPLLLNNLQATLGRGELRPFAPQQHYLQICNLGDDRGLLRRGAFAAQGRLPFWLKDRIDRRFMRRFSAPAQGERG